MTRYPPTPGSRRLVAGLALVAALGLAAAGCSDDGDGEDQAQDGIQAKRDPSDLEPVELPEANGEADQDGTEGEDGDGAVKRPNEPEPNVDLTGDPAEAWRQIQTYRTWLYSHPDPAKVKRINHPRCKCYHNAVELLTRYAENGQWWTGPETEILNVETLWIADDQSHAKIRVVDKQPAESKLIDETGKVHGTVGPRGEATTEYGLTREGPGHPWRVLTFKRIEE